MRTGLWISGLLFNTIPKFFQQKQGQKPVFQITIQNNLDLFQKVFQKDSASCFDLEFLLEHFFCSAMGRYAFQNKLARFLLEHFAITKSTFFDLECLLEENSSFSTVLEQLFEFWPKDHGVLGFGVGRCGVNFGRKHIIFNRLLAGCSQIIAEWVFISEKALLLRGWSPAPRKTCPNGNFSKEKPHF